MVNRPVEIQGFPFKRYPLNNITPFSYRDGHTFLENIESVRRELADLLENDILQNTSINDFVIKVNETLADLMSKLVGYTIEVTEDQYVASMMDGTTFAAYTIEGIDRIIAAVNQTMNGKIDTLRTDTATSLASVDAAMAANKLASDNADAALTNSLNTLSGSVDNRFIGVANTFTTVNNALADKASKNIFINVADYGAKGNGTTDDAAAIRAAVNAGGPGANIHFPKGTYLIKSTVNVLEDQRWTGSSSCFGDNNANSSIKSTFTGVALSVNYGATLENLRIQGPGSGVANSVGINSLKYLTIRDCSIYGFATGFYANENWYTHVERCKFYLNALAMDINYCYNFSIYNVEIIADKGGLNFGDGIKLDTASMVTMIGGSIESYETGVMLKPGCSIAMYGVYFESKDDGTVTKARRGVVMDGGRIRVLASGCQVYLTSHKAWIDASRADAGESIAGYGNVFKGGKDGQSGFAYEWNGNGELGRLQVALSGDAFGHVRANTYQYRSASIPTGAMINDPSYFYPAKGGWKSTVFGGHVMAGGAIVPGSGSTLPGIEAEGGKGMTGAMFWSTTVNKPVFWSGSKWVYADGTTYTG